MIGGETETSNKPKSHGSNSDNSHDPKKVPENLNKRQSNSDKSDSESSSCKEPLSDVWIFDTFSKVWTQIDPALRVQGSMAGKKIKKYFEPRLAHTAVLIDSFVVLFGGLNSQKNSLISNDIYVLCLDRFTERIMPHSVY